MNSVPLPHLPLFIMKPTSREEKHSTCVQEPVFLLKLVPLWVRHAAPLNSASDRTAQIMCTGVGVKLNYKLKMEML